MILVLPWKKRGKKERKCWLKIRIIYYLNKYSMQDDPQAKYEDSLLQQKDAKDEHFQVFFPLRLTLGLRCVFKTKWQWWIICRESLARGRIWEQVNTGISSANQISLLLTEEKLNDIMLVNTSLKATVAFMRSHSAGKDCWHICTLIHTHTDTLIHTHSHTHTHTHTHTLIHTHTHTLIHTHTHTHTHTRTPLSLSLTHTHTHTHDSLSINIIPIVPTNFSGRPRDPLFTPDCRLTLRNTMTGYIHQVSAHLEAVQQPL